MASDNGTTSVAKEAFGFAGELHAANGLVDLRARHYSPALGRFLTTDPFSGTASDPRSMHRYQYAHANPVRWTDPTGLFTGSLVEVNAAQASQSQIANILTGLILLKLLTDVTTAIEEAKERQIARTCAVANAVGITVDGALVEHCRSRGADIYFPGFEDQFDTALHNALAISAGHPAFLNKRVSRHPDGWLRSTEECRDNYGRASETGLQCDEYPFASTVKGGRGSSVMLVSADDNGVQGRTLRTFFSRCNITGYSNTGFVVAPVNVGPTTHICSDGTS